MLPKRIYALWDSGRDNAPELVRAAFASWDRHAPGYEQVILDGDDLRRHLDDIGLGSRRLTIQAASDIVRTKLLAEGGGVWLDATCYLTADLDGWIAAATRPSGFFAFWRPGPDRPLSSWCLAAAPDNLLAKRMLAALIRYWSIDRQMYTGFEGARKWRPLKHRIRRRALGDPVWAVTPGGGAQYPFYPYFMFHHLFDYLVATDPEAGDVWARTPKLSAVLPHVLQSAQACGPLAELDTASLRALIDASPIHKLNWRKSFPLEMMSTLSGGPVTHPA